METNEKVFGGKYGTITESNLEKLIDMGANRWTKAGRDRLYLSGAGAEIMGLEVDRYKTGNISSACLNGVGISNSKAGRLMGAYQTAYIDLESGRLFVSDRPHLQDEVEMFREAMAEYITVA